MRRKLGKANFGCGRYTVRVVLIQDRNDATGHPTFGFLLVGLHVRLNQPTSKMFFVTSSSLCDGDSETSILPTESLEAL